MTVGTCWCVRFFLEKGFSMQAGLEYIGDFLMALAAINGIQSGRMLTILQNSIRMAVGAAFFSMNAGCELFFIDEQLDFFVRAGRFEGFIGVAIHARISRFRMGCHGNDAYRRKEKNPLVPKNGAKIKHHEILFNKVCSQTLIWGDFNYYPEII